MSKKRPSSHLDTSTVAMKSEDPVMTFWGETYSQWMMKTSLKPLAMALAIPHVLLLGVFVLTIILNGDQHPPLKLYHVILVHPNPELFLADLIQALTSFQVEASELTWPAPLNEYLIFPVILLPFFILSVACFQRSLKYIPYNSKHPFLSSFLYNYHLWPSTSKARKMALTKEEYLRKQPKNMKKKLDEVGDDLFIVTLEDFVQKYGPDQGSRRLQACFTLLGLIVHFLGYLLLYDTMLYSFYWQSLDTTIRMTMDKSGQIITSASEFENLFSGFLLIGFWLGGYILYFLFYVFPLVGIRINKKQLESSTGLAIFIGTMLLAFPLAFILTIVFFILLLLSMTMTSITASIIAFVLSFVWSGDPTMNYLIPLQSNSNQNISIILTLGVNISPVMLVALIIFAIRSSSSKWEIRQLFKTYLNPKETVTRSSVNMMDYIDMEQTWKNVMLYKTLRELISYQSISEREILQNSNLILSKDVLYDKLLEKEENKRQSTKKKMADDSKKELIAMLKQWSSAPESLILDHFGYESMEEFLVAVARKKKQDKQRPLLERILERVGLSRFSSTKALMTSGSLLVIDENLWKGVIKLSRQLTIKDLATALTRAMIDLPKDHPIANHPLTVIKQLEQHEQNLKTVLQLYWQQKRSPTFLEGLIKGQLNLFDLPISIDLALLPFEDHIDWERIRPNLLKEIQEWHDTAAATLSTTPENFTILDLVLKTSLSYFQARCVMAFCKTRQEQEIE